MWAPDWRNGDKTHPCALPASAEGSHLGSPAPQVGQAGSLHHHLDHCLLTRSICLSDLNRRMKKHLSSGGLYALCYTYFVIGVSLM